ncbi:unnamed protein product [Oikopleura dioica]|uniref:Uncharacterized protein n=1 Tax=Oikopleura dioica TaxID=34765 RepID=E4Y1H1_OIKDI|nr:unnamed protein product [Oikopleura dioica]
MKPNPFLGNCFVTLATKGIIDLGAVKDSATHYVIDTQLPGYLNRFEYQKTDSDGSHSDSDSLRKNGKSISSDGMDDSGMGSASDSGRRTGNSDSEPETLSVKNRAENDGLTYEQILQNSTTKRPKRNGSTLSRFSNIFKSDGKKLADSLTEEFHLNDRFSGLSMDRIWGGFLQQLNAEEEKDANAINQVSRLDTIEEQESAGTGTEDSLRASQQQRQRRRRRRQRKHVQRADSWQKELPADWQNVLSI